VHRNIQCSKVFVVVRSYKEHFSTSRNVP
jgi:hypothetical protein